MIQQMELKIVNTKNTSRNTTDMSFAGHYKTYIFAFFADNVTFYKNSCKFSEQLKRSYCTTGRQQRHYNRYIQQRYLSWDNKVYSIQG